MNNFVSLMIGMDLLGERKNSAYHQTISLSNELRLTSLYELKILHLRDLNKSRDYLLWILIGIVLHRLSWCIRLI
jgi:hypothetical protein